MSNMQYKCPQYFTEKTQKSQLLQNKYKKLIGYLSCNSKIKKSDWLTKKLLLNKKNYFKNETTKHWL